MSRERTPKRIESAIRPRFVRESFLVYGTDHEEYRLCRIVIHLAVEPNLARTLQRAGSRTSGFQEVPRIEDLLVASASAVRTRIRCELWSRTTSLHDGSPRAQSRDYPDERKSRLRSDPVAMRRTAQRLAFPCGVRPDLQLTRT